MSTGGLERAHLANALFDAHHGDPEFGHRLLGDEAARPVMSLDLLSISVQSPTAAKPLLSLVAVLLGRVDDGAGDQGMRTSRG